MLAVDTPVLHNSVPVQLLTVRVTDEVSHIDSFEATITGAMPLVMIETGSELTLEQPLTVQVAVYVVLVSGFTTVVVPAAPLDQVTVPVQLLAVSVTLSFTQTVSFPAVTIGA